jgi:hypothetical protein
MKIHWQFWTVEVLAKVNLADFCRAGMSWRVARAGVNHKNFSVILNSRQSG